MREKVSEMYNFIAYADNPKIIGKTLEPINNLKTLPVKTKTWSQMDILGNSISEEIFDEISHCYNFIGDISVLNFNVVFEIGYAIGK